MAKKKVGKTSIKKTAVQGKGVAKKSPPKSATPKETKGKTAGLKKAAPKQVGGKKVPLKKAAVEAPQTASARPAGKPHVHAAGDAGVEAPRGRARKETSGPMHGGISDEAVRKATGRGWEEWLALLDGEGAIGMEHKALAAMLRDKHGVDEWWAQSVTVGYEQARGKREKYETPDGYQTGVSKTIQAPVAKLYKAWEDAGTRERWLGDHEVEVRTATPEKSMRMTWLTKGADEGSSVEVYFWPKDSNRCLVQVQHRKLADAAAVQRVRAFWSVKLENLRSVMEKGG
jgi:uncharacterized protein YndB with AHSA1/START domain